MSKRDLSIDGLQDVKVDVMTQKPRGIRDDAKPYHGGQNVDRGSEFVYVNSAFVGSLNSVSEGRTAPPTGVYREQYWACSKWPFGQRILAVSVGLLVGAVIGLAVTMAIRASGGDTDITAIFRSSPD